MAIERGDFILLTGLAMAALAGGAWYGARHLLGSGESDAGSLTVVCQSKDGFYRADPLSSDVEYEVKTPGTGSGRDAHGGTNLVRIHGGIVWIEQANCENQLCVKHDPVRREGEQIVCLPHGVVVQVAKRAQDVALLQ